MKLKLDPDEVCELLDAANVIQVRGCRVKDINWNRTYNNFEVILEKSPVDQGLPVGAQNQLGRASHDARLPRPTTPSFVPEYDRDRDNPLPE